MLNEQDEQTLRELIRKTEPKAAQAAELVPQKASTIVIDYLRKLVREVYEELEAPDGRYATFSHEMTLWNVTQGEATGDAVRVWPRTKVSGLLATLKDVGALVAHHQNIIPPPHHPLSTVSAKKRLKGFRVSLGQNGGECMYRIKYEHNGKKYMVTAVIRREKDED